MKIWMGKTSAERKTPYRIYHESNNFPFPFDKFKWNTADDRDEHEMKVYVEINICRCKENRVIIMSFCIWCSRSIIIRCVRRCSMCIAYENRWAERMRRKSDGISWSGSSSINAELNDWTTELRGNKYKSQNYFRYILSRSQVEHQQNARIWVNLCDHPLHYTWT